MMVIGSDLVEDLVTWDDGIKFITEITFLIYLRKSYPLPPKDKMPKLFILAEDYEIDDDSSTSVRECLS